MFRYAPRAGQCPQLVSVSVSSKSWPVSLSVCLSQYAPRAGQCPQLVSVSVAPRAGQCPQFVYASVRSKSWPVSPVCFCLGTLQELANVPSLFVSVRSKRWPVSPAYLCLSTLQELASSPSLFLSQYFPRAGQCPQFCFCLSTFQELASVPSLFLSQYAPRAGQCPRLVCSLRSDCSDAAKDPLYWISYKSGRCTTITAVTPNQLQRTTARTLDKTFTTILNGASQQPELSSTPGLQFPRRNSRPNCCELDLVIDNLPTLSGQFLCAFTALDKTLITNATRKSYGVNCTTPRTDQLPSIPPGQHHFTAKLSVRMTSGPDFVATNFTFFDCNTYSSCTQCVSSSFPCDWCVDGHRCTHDTAENCRNDILVTGVSQFIVQTRFVCQFNIEGRVTSVNAQLLGDTIYCDQMEFTYTSRAPNITATFAVIWGGSKPLDNPDNIHVVIYRCRDMADNCGMCLALAEKYGCGWCQVSDRCEVKDQCDQGTGVWLNRNQTCPNPEVISFEPQLGPWEGGTNITIRGINLGKTFNDIYGGVSVAGIPCEPYAHLYTKTKLIVCYVDGPGTNEPRRGPVIVRVEDFRGESKHNYEFVDPVIDAISPKYGPRSGGTKIKINGKYMNAGSRIQAFIDDIPCEIIGTSAEEAECKTSASDRQRSGKLRMKFDKGDRIFDKDLFEYVEDPTIESAESGVAGQVKIPKGIPAGGIRISVSGKNLAYIQNPRMYVYYKDKQFSSTCVVLSNSNMACSSPTIEFDKEPDAENPMKLEYGFLMDNVTGVQNLSMDHNPFLLYPNPIYDKFDEEVKYYKSDYLTINGQHLDRACQESDVVVQIGNSFCNVTSLSRQQLTCRPPTTQPPALDEDGHVNPQELPQVVVIVGGTLRYVIGKLSYASPAGLNGALSKPALYSIIGVIVLLVIVFAAFLIAYRRKSTESNRVLKNMQEQMDILELRVAAECKEAFAELQTEMTDLTGDLTLGGIPFLEYRTYAMKILFPNMDDHAVLQWERPELLRKEKGLRLFGQLIMNKTFLLLFIRTLESNRYFSMRDRVNVASLIMVTLQSKMEYCTDILKTLLAELIEKVMESKSHPKLLLRRTAILQSDVISVVLELSIRVQVGSILLIVDSLARRVFSVYLIKSGLTSVKESLLLSGVARRYSSHKIDLPNYVPQAQIFLLAVALVSRRSVNEALA
uniref:Plexin A n=1 Tax=Timema tahoe TaxID=61484 RepID=A0A7R9IIV3_9NEOP|nr:unnamed protein product [Timema tahoe]